MFFLLIVISLVASVGGARRRTCPPFDETDEFTYEYVKITRRHWYNITTTPVSPLPNGDYPEFTDALMYCKTGNGKRSKLAELAGQCNNNEWVKEGEEPLKCPIRGCLRLPENSTHSYEYFYQVCQPAEAKRHVIAPVDWSGKFIEYTYAKRFCTEFPKNSRVQGHVVAKCLSTA